MQQAYKKGKIVESWHQKIVFVVQDLAIEYLQHTTDCSKLTSYNPDYPIDFCSFNLSWKEGKGWVLAFDQIRSTTIEGINDILGGAKVSMYPTIEDFIGNIVKKGVSDGILQNNSYTRSQYEGK